MTDRDLRPLRDGRAAPPLQHAGVAVGKELEEIVYDVELLDDEGPGEPASVLPALAEAHAGDIEPSRPRQLARGTVRVTVTIGQGWRSWLLRAWDGLTWGTYRRHIRAAEIAGDHVQALAWVNARDKAKHERHARLRELPAVWFGLARMALIGVIVALIVVAFVDVLVGATGAGGWFTIWGWLFTALYWVCVIVGWLWAPGLAGVLVAILVAAFREGERHGVPMWVVSPEELATEGRDVIPDEGAILNALRNLGLTPLNQAFKAGWRPVFVLGTGRDGKGYRTQLQLPQGVTVEMINLRKDILAHNLVRLPVEVWPTEPKTQPGVLDLWVADQGSLTGPVDPWPLLKGGTVDYFKGVPVAVNIQGRSIMGRLSEANYAMAGMMGSGKSTLIITLLLGAILDPLVEADVFVMAVNADYQLMKPRLRTLMTGAGDHVVEACMNTLRNAYADLDVRGQALMEHGVQNVNREVAAKDPRLRPRIIVIDECQALFMHDEYKEEAISLAVRLINAARKYGLTLILATPEASSDSLPRKVMTVTSNKACFAIGDQQSNDAVLGTGSYKAGISAVGLEPKTEESNGDIGTFMARGFTPKPGLLRGYYLTREQVAAVVARAMEARQRTPAAARPVERRDLLEDVAAVLGDEPKSAPELPALLRELAPGWAPYRKLTGKQLVVDLEALGVRVPSTDNRWPVRLSAVREALARRELEAEGDAN